MRGCDVAAVITEFFQAESSAVLIGVLDEDISAVADAADLEIGYSELDAGHWAIRIDDELMIASQVDGVLTFQTGSRGYFGTTAGVHVSGTEVTVARLCDCCATRAYLGGAPSGYANVQPALVWNFGGGIVESTYGFQRLRVQVKCYGGRDSEQNYPAYAADAVYRALLRRCVEVASPEIVASGVITSVVVDIAGQSLVEPDITPSWPYSLMFLDFEIRGRLR